MVFLLTYSAEAMALVLLPSAMSCKTSRSLGERLAGSDLELLNLGDTSPATEQLGVIVDGTIRCGLRRLGLARNGIDAEGVTHVARFLEGGKCEGLERTVTVTDYQRALTPAGEETYEIGALEKVQRNMQNTWTCVSSMFKDC